MSSCRATNANGFAAAALQGLLAAGADQFEVDDRAFKIADRMMEQRRK